MPWRSRRSAVVVVAASALPLVLPATGSASPAVAASRPSLGPAAVQAAATAAAAPGARVDTLVSGLSIPWDVAPTPDGGLLFTERGGNTWFRDSAGTARVLTTDHADVFVAMEAGLEGITTDPGFASNRTYYTCQAHQEGGTAVDVRVVRWHLADDARSATRQGTVVTGLPITSGRHAGCRLRFAPDGTLHIGTGDAVTGTNPQNLDSLGGKTLRVNASDGSAPSDNPFASSGGARALVFTYGHRNVQGLAVRPGTSEMWNAEHGPSRDDEVNLLVSGGNYGWDPIPGYNESTPMTDTTKFPSAVPARWSSGYPTVATSGITFLTGSKWGRWEGALAVAELKGQGVRILSLTPDGRVRGNEQFPLLDNTYGRIRTVQAAPGGNAIYVTTSNSTTTAVDRLMRITATASQPAYSQGVDVSPSGVAVVNRAGALTAYVRGTNGQVYFATQSSAGGAWTGFTSIPGVVASAPAAVSWGGSRVDLFARGQNGHLLHASSDGGSTYSPWQDLGGSIIGAPAVTSLASGTLDVVARGTTDALLRTRWDGTAWTGFTSLDGIISAAPAVTADPGAGQVTAYVRGRDGRLWRIVLTPTGVAAGWAAVPDRSTWAAPGVSSAGSPVLVTRNSDLTPVVSISGFTTAVGGQVTGAMAVAERSSTSYTVIGRGTDNALWSFDGRPGHYTWSKVGGKLS